MLKGMRKREKTKVETLIDRNIVIPCGIEISSIKDVLPEIIDLLYRFQVSRALELSRGYAKKIKNREEIEKLILIVYSRDEQYVCMSMKKGTFIGILGNSSMYIQYDILKKQIKYTRPSFAPLSSSSPVWEISLAEFINKYTIHDYWLKVKEIFSESIIELVNLIQEKKRYNSMIQGDKEYEKLEYSVADLERDMYQLAAIEIDHNIYLNKESLLEEHLKNNINSIYLIMDLEDFWYKKPMVVHLGNTISVAQHIEKNTMEECFSEIKDKFVTLKTEKVIYKKNIPVPFWDKQENMGNPMCLTEIKEQLKNKFYIEFKHRKSDFFWDNEIHVTTQIDDKHYSKTPEEEFESDVLTGEYNEHPDISIEIDYLNGINGFTLNSKGIYYVKEKSVMFRNKIDGKEQLIAETNRFLNMFATNDYLFITESQSFQCASSYINDDLGYYAADMYKIIPSTRIINLTTNKEIALWENFYPVSGIIEKDGVYVIGEIVSGNTWNGYCLSGITDQSIKNMENFEIRKKAKWMNVTYQTCNSNIFKEVSVDSVIMRVHDDVYYYSNGVIKKINCKK